MFSEKGSWLSRPWEFYTQWKSATRKPLMDLLLLLLLIKRHYLHSEQNLGRGWKREWQLMGVVVCDQPGDESKGLSRRTKAVAKGWQITQTSVDIFFKSLNSQPSIRWGFPFGQANCGGCFCLALHYINCFLSAAGETNGSGGCIFCSDFPLWSKDQRPGAAPTPFPCGAIYTLHFTFCVGATWKSPKTN